MPFLLLAIGLLMIVVAIRNTQGQLGTLLVGDFTGMPNFLYWIVAIFIIGAIGYVDELKAPSDAMLALVILAILLSNRGFFQQFTQQLQSGSAQAPPPGPPSPVPGTATPASAPGNSGSTGPGGIFQTVSGAAQNSGGILNAAATVASFL